MALEMIGPMPGMLISRSHFFITAGQAQVVDMDFDWRASDRALMHFPVRGHAGLSQYQGHKEFGAEARPEGWNLTFAISPAAAPPPQARRPIVSK